MNSPTPTGHAKPPNTLLNKYEAGMTVADMRTMLAISHGDAPIKVKIGDAYLDIREFRQVSFAPGETVIIALVPTDVPVDK